MTVLAHQGTVPADQDGPATSVEPSGPSVGHLAAQLSEQVSRLVRDELALAQTEVKQRAKKVGLGIGLFGVSGFIAVFGLACLIAAAVLGLSLAVNAWLAAVIVGVVLFAVAGAVALLGKRDLSADHPAVPGDSIDSLKADVTAVKGALHR